MAILPGSIDLFIGHSGLVIGHLTAACFGWPVVVKFLAMKRLPLTPYPLPLAYPLPLILIVLLAGCEPETGAISGVNKNDADSLNAQRANFENSEDPPLTAETRFAAGRLAETQGGTQNAIEQYKAALKLDPHHLAAMYRLAVVYTQLRAWPEAVAAWKEYAKETNDANAYGNLGFCHSLAGQYVEAEAAFKAGIEKNPKNVLCRVNYGLMLVRIGRADEGLKQMQEVLTEQQAHYNVASVYEQQGKAEAAQAEFKKAGELGKGK